MFYTEPCCRLRIQKAGSRNRDHRRSLQKSVSASVYVPACGTLPASTLPGTQTIGVDGKEKEEKKKKVKNTDTVFKMMMNV